MKIAFLISDISLNRGGERSTAILANALVASSEVTIVSLYRENTENFFEIDNQIKKSYINMRPRAKNWGRKALLKLLEVKRLANLIRHKEVDLWIGVGTYCAVLLGMLNFLNKKPKYIAWEHSNFDAATKKWRMLRGFFFKQVTAVACLNQSDYQSYQQISNRVTVIPNMLPFEIKTPAIRTEKRILSIGAFEEEKGFDLLIEAFDKIKDQTDWNLKLIGSGSKEKALISLISAKQLENRIVIDAPTKDIIEQYLTASIYVLSSRREGFPMVLLEAAECGLPRIAFDCETGPGHLIEDQISGLLVPAENIELLAEAMLRLIKDHFFAEKLAKTGKELIKKYQPKNVLETWYSLFKELGIDYRN